MINHNIETNKTHPNAEWKPWERSTGPLTIKGKRKSSRNSLKHGYYREVFREFRKNRRKPETIRVEGMCICLIIAGRIDDVEKLSQIIGDIQDSIVEIWRSVVKDRLDTGSMMELKYVFTLCESVIRYSTVNVVRNLNQQIKEQYEKQQ